MMTGRSRLARMGMAVFCGAIFVAALVAVSAIAADERDAAASKPEVEPPAGWKMVWSDEFDGAEVDRAKWGFDLGNRLPGGQPGWGNDELQFYTSRPENVYVKDGTLHVRTVREEHQGAPYTSARLKTKGLFAQKFGRFEVRAKLPVGRGVWPAIWMLPEDNTYGGWAASGEIDIMEARGQEPEKVLGTLHYGSGWPANVHSGKDYVLPGRGSIAEFHVYALEWDPGEMRWYVDGKLYQTQGFWWSSSKRDGANGVPPANASELNPWPAPFDQPFHLLLNVAVGGRFLGNPDGDTMFPVEMVVDYVRAYQREHGNQGTKPRGPGNLPF